MKYPLEHLIDRCIAQLNNGMDLEVVLEQVSDDADELRPILAAVAWVRLEIPAPAVTRRLAGKQAIMAAAAHCRRTMESTQGLLNEIKAGVPIAELLARATPEQRPVVLPSPASGPRREPPALLTRMSMRPNSSSVRWTRRVTCSSFLTSVGTARQRAPDSSRTRAAARSSSSAVRLAMTTAAPLRANCRAVARPMPVPPPVTMATRPVKSEWSGFMGFTISFVVDTRAPAGAVARLVPVASPPACLQAGGGATRPASRA